MSANAQSIATNQIDASGNRSLKQNQKQIFYRQNEQNYRTQTNPNYENQSLTGSAHGPTQAQGHQKTQVIQMRKINPISKTAQTASKNTSIDMKKTSSNGMQMHNILFYGGWDAQHPISWRLTCTTSYSMEVGMHNLTSYFMEVGMRNVLFYGGWYT